MRPSYVKRSLAFGSVLALAALVGATPLAGASAEVGPKKPRPEREAATVASASAPTSGVALGVPPSPTRWLDPRFGIVEGSANPSAMAEIGAGWQRVVFAWDQVQPSRAGNFSGLGWTLSRATLEQELRRGGRVTGLLQFTPAWAATNPAHGPRAVPRNLFLPFDHPDNYFGQFVYQTVKYYAGWVDEWIIWNEPEFRPHDEGGGESYTWLGSDEEFARLLQVGYLAAKRANPGATVSSPATSYWVEEMNDRPQFYERQLALMAHDPEAAANNHYHDVVSLNLYRNADDLYRIHGEFKAIQHAYGVDKPIWLTETNAMPTDDWRVSCWEQHAGGFYGTTMHEQSSYAVQAFALAAAAGYERMELYKMVDDNPCHQVALWGVTRDDGTRRPVADALRTAIAHFSGFTSAQFVPLERPWERWPAWPNHPDSYAPNWQVYQVALDRPDGQRVTVLWNGDGAPLRVRIPRYGWGAHALDARGAEQVLEDHGDAWVVTLPGATSRTGILGGPVGYHPIGGDPLLIVEEGVDPWSAVLVPHLE